VPLIEDRVLVELHRAAALAGRPLWPDAIPSLMQEHWDRLKSGLPKSEHWEVWTRWYEARCNGQPPVEALERYRVLRDQAFWRQSPQQINAAIAEEERRWRSLEPRPAPFDYYVVDDKIDVAPETAPSIDAGTSLDLRDECLRKARAVHERLSRMQADENLRADIGMLLGRLTSEVLRPGLILSSLRSLEATAKAYDSNEGRAQLHPDALKDLIDLADTLRDLAATFPKSREIEAEAVTLALPLERLDEIARPVANAGAAIDASDGVTDATRDSFHETAAAIATSRDLADRAKQLAYHILDLGNIARAGLRHLKTTGRRIVAPAAATARVGGREVGGVAGDVWKEFRKDLPKRAGRAASIAVVGGISGLLHAIGQDLPALASIVVAFLPITQTIQDLQAAPTEQQHPGAPVSTDASGNDPVDHTANDLTVPKSRKRPAARRRKPRQAP